RALEDQHEPVELAVGCLLPPPDQLVAVVVVEQRPVQDDLGKAGEAALDDLLEARLHRRRERHGVAVAAQSGIHPDDVDDRGARRGRHVPGAYGHRPDPALDRERKLQASPLISPIRLPAWRLRPELRAAAAEEGENTAYTA